MKKPKKKSFDSNIAAIDIFCGAGGLAKGLSRSGIDVRLGVDADSACEYPFTINNDAEFMLSRVEKLQPKDIRRYFKGARIRVLAGCAPCQTFSTYNQKADKKDHRWDLLKNFSSLVRSIKPEIVTMENVPGLVKHKVFSKFLKDLRQAKYHVSYKIVNCADYGIPQTRRRLVLLASRLGPIEMSKPRKRKQKATVRKAIGKMPRIKAGSFNKKDPLHICAALSKKNMTRIKSSIPGKTWRTWNTKLVTRCHRKKNGKTYSGVYGRMQWDEPGPTITTQFYGFGNGRFGHPSQNRALSLREGAILQTFPRSYKFVRPKEPLFIKRVGRLIGNAVPVQLGQVIGKNIRRHVEFYQKEL